MRINYEVSESVDDLSVLVYYRNHKGEERWRSVMPESIWFGATEWHPEQQWFMDVIDDETGQRRSFAMRDILHFGLENPPT